MKPSWDKAPKWAQWLAMDSDGQWIWFAEEPEEEWGGVWETSTKIKYEYAYGYKSKSWRDTPEKRDSI